MIVHSNVGGPGQALRRKARARLAASIDVEWSKNYKVKNGNRPFCYSVVWAELLKQRTPIDLGSIRWGFTSVYLDNDTERPDLIELVATDLTAVLGEADYVTGHQLCSDLAVLAANTRSVPQAIRQAQQAWHDRRTDRKVIDTRFDAGHLLTGTSRRLVDVCTELHLDVTQPELARKSMTALHRTGWLIATMRPASASRSSTCATACPPPSSRSAPPESAPGPASSTSTACLPPTSTTTSTGSTTPPSNSFSRSLRMS